ncbi:nucleotidyltransferase family protein [Ruegeria atlantica]|uniref:Bifunctional N-acetylglucosamine-1-phosphate uridyltransferase/glucosamine-1-phosphate acetyltransferase n=1 Tax=Ruegeria atlantica TaxID=81569 RepID=A0A0P1EHR5_9RHOB|nr:nucleotidyltransferase family protein [Ruegeria atlantica]CUH49955.1 bifunctional N-acetylglucosamine-1-phosphate uridyltransferase/glucosamine-1-phosphate acetyltransferase [Ruegeria atlantica]
MIQDPEAVMLFAAGFGTRMGALTQNRPKPLIEVAGRPLIDHALDLVNDLQPKRIVANLHYLPDQLEAHLGPKGVLLSHEKPEILETGGGIRAALPLLGSHPVYTLNPDAIWSGPNPLTMLREAWNPDHMDALLMCVPVDQTVGHTGKGDFTADENGRIVRGDRLIYGGAQIMKSEGLKDIPEKAFSLNVLWDRLQRQDRLFALTYPGRWCDVGHPEGITLAEGLIADV